MARRKNQQLNTPLKITKTTHNKYRPPVAIVYGTMRGVHFTQSFKSINAATKCAKQYNGTLVLLNKEGK